MAVAQSDLIVDYIIFLIFIIGTTIWPLWSRNRSPQTKANYVFAAGGGISMGAMMLSLARGTLGVRTFLGSPSELFYRGSAMWEMVYGMALAFPLVSILFVPVYYSLGITSVYQYLDLRFKSRAVRCLASGTYIFRHLLVLGTSIFTPCVALNTIIGLPYWVSIVGITSISVLFTIFGGLKAAIKADVIQGLTMIFISIAIIIQCCVEVKGVSPIVTVPSERGRLQFFQRVVADLLMFHGIVNDAYDSPELVQLIQYHIPTRNTRQAVTFHCDNVRSNYKAHSPIRRLHSEGNELGYVFDIFNDTKLKVKELLGEHFAQGLVCRTSAKWFNGDPTVRVDTVSALLGQLFMSVSLYGCQQNFVQRYVSMKSQQEVKRTLTFVIPVLISLFSLSWICGMGIFATYADCDPLTSGYIQKMDEILPFFIADKFQYIPGLMGLFLGSLFNGALSFSVSNINSIATVTFEDFISHMPAFKNMKDHQQLVTIKVLGAIYGVIIMGISFCVGMLSGVMESGILMTSATSGPLLGVFILAMFVPCATWKGAIAGMVSSHIVTMWITVGHFVYDTREVEMLSLSTAGCTNDTFSKDLSKPGHQWPIPVIPKEVNMNTTNFLQYLNHYNTTSTPISEYSNPFQPLYMMTYMYYALLGTFVTLFVGIVVSLLFKLEESDRYEENLLHPFVLKLSKRFCNNPRRFITKENTPSSNGVSHLEKTNNNNCKEIDNPAFEMCDNLSKDTSLDVQDNLSKTPDVQIIIPQSEDLHRRENVNKIILPSVECCRTFSGEGQNGQQCTKI